MLLYAVKNSNIINGGGVIKMSDEKDVYFLALLTEISEKLDITNNLLKEINVKASSIDEHTDYIFTVKNEIENLHDTIKELEK